MNNRIGSYVFTDDGRILKEDQEVEIVNGNIRLDLSIGVVIAQAAKLFVIARSAMLDLECYQHILVFFNDEDKDNYSVNNIEYIFSPALPCAENKGFFVVPNFTRYAINNEGVLVNRKTKEEKKWAIAAGNTNKNIKGGYFVGSAVADSGKYTGIQRHRLLGLVFFPPETNPRKLWINHIDGIPGRDEFDNLEWSTPGQNIKHAYRTGLCTQSLAKVAIRNAETGKVREFNSIIECAEYFSVSHSTITLRIEKPSIVFDGYQFKRDDNSDWPEIKRVSRGKPEQVPLVGRNVFTGEQKRFKNSVVAEKETGYSALGIVKHAKERRTAPIGEWNFRLDSAEETFPNHCQLNLETYKVYPHKPPMPIVGVNVEKTFLSAKEFGNYLSLSPSVAAAYARSGKAVNGEIYKQLRREDDLGIPIPILT